MMRPDTSASWFAVLLWAVVVAAVFALVLCNLDWLATSAYWRGF